MLKYDADGLLHRGVPGPQFALEFVIQAPHRKFTPFAGSRIIERNQAGALAAPRTDRAEFAGLR